MLRLRTAFPVFEIFELHREREDVPRALAGPREAPRARHTHSRLQHLSEGARMRLATSAQVAIQARAASRGPCTRAPPSAVTNRLYQLLWHSRCDLGLDLCIQPIQSESQHWPMLSLPDGAVAGVR